MNRPNQYETLYELNETFVVGESANPVNIEEIRFSLLAERYGIAYTNRISRLIRGFSIYIFIIIFVWGTSLILSVHLMAQQYIQFAFWSISAPSATLLLSKYTFGYLTSKEHQLNTWIGYLYAKGNFYEGRILSKEINSNGIKVYYTFSTANKQNIIGIYIIQDTLHECGDMVTVWYFGKENEEVYTLL